jgi:GH15 family glucan-1,4-alpha-glucosidase
MDRGRAMIEQLRPPDDRAATWTAACAELRRSILTRGWNHDVGAYTQSYGSDALDAATLLMAVVGFLPSDHGRLLATIDAIEAGLTDERGLLYRYRGGDGFDQPEGTFLLCTFWPAHAVALTGQVTRARATLDRAAGFATELGLFAEQVDPATGQLLGNFPQAFSHLGLVNAAQALADAERPTASPPS